MKIKIYLITNKIFWFTKNQVEDKNFYRDFYIQNIKFYWLFNY